MPDFSQIGREFNCVSAEFLLADLDVGLTFMDVAATTQDPETVRRNHKNARLAYDTVLGFMPRLALTEADRQTVEDKLAALGTRLRAAGVEL